MIIRDFDLDTEDAALPLEKEEALHERLLFVLTQQVQYLIDHDMERLKWLLYRIDVSEPKLHSALTEHTPVEAPRIIAQMVIDRQIEKAITRARFSTNEGSEWKDC